MIADRVEIVGADMEVTIASTGDETSKQFRVFALKQVTDGDEPAVGKERSSTITDGQSVQPISMWHDVPLHPESFVVNMICEIPRNTRKKFEIATTESANPIKQDIKDGKLREFRKGDVYFNYGCLPRTWEDPNEIDQYANRPGDNDPLDVCEIGLRIMKVAEISPVKVLGVLCLIDEGEADWKVIAISCSDPWSGLLNDVSDIERLLPGTLDSIREWFRTYKAFDGKPPNEFGMSGEFQSASFAKMIVNHAHMSWRKLVSGHYDRKPSDDLADGELPPRIKTRLLALPDQSADNMMH